jgi:glycosyltransferase involved in cell wall biosynthesis
MRKLAQDVDLFLAPSAYLRDEFIDFGIPAGKVICSDYGFETAGFTKRNDLPRVARRFGFLGSLMHHKGVHVLLEAFEGLPTDARLDICGALHYDPGYTKALQSRVVHPGVNFVGSRSPEEVPRFLREIDCLVVPSIWQENSPLTIHEAFLSGVPVVASRMGGHPGLLGEGGGLLYDADDVPELRSQLQWLYESPGALTDLAESVPPVKPMSDHVVELVELYEGLVEKARSQA